MSRPLGGIGGIERKIKDKHEITDKHIDHAFQDLQQLMQMVYDLLFFKFNPI
jgi:hypothetical protein